MDRSLRTDFPAFVKDPPDTPLTIAGRPQSLPLALLAGQRENAPPMYLTAAPCRELSPGSAEPSWAACARAQQYTGVTSNRRHPRKSGADTTPARADDGAGEAEEGLGDVVEDLPAERAAAGTSAAAARSTARSPTISVGAQTGTMIRATAGDHRRDALGPGLTTLVCHGHSLGQRPRSGGIAASMGMS